MNKRNKVVAVITSICWLPLWHLSRFLRRLSKILTLRLCLVPKLDIISLSLTKAAYSWQVLYLKLAFAWWDIHCNKSQNYNGHWECYRRSGC